MFIRIFGVEFTKFAAANHLNRHLLARKPEVKRAQFVRRPPTEHRPIRQQPTAMQQQNTARQSGRLCEVMRRNKYRRVLARQRSDRLPKLCRPFRIKAARRLIQQQHRRDA